MATITKRGESWFAQIRRKGHKSISKSFPTKGRAQEWARKVEREIDTMSFKVRRSLTHICLNDLIDKYISNTGAVKPFGRNKLAVLSALKKLGNTTLPDLTAETLVGHIKMRAGQRADGVTVSVELTYLGPMIQRKASRLQINP